jgi:hypothetical protein
LTEVHEPRKAKVVAMTPSGSFFSELRRRRVYHVVAFYSAAAWGITEALAFIFEKLYFPEWSVVLVTLLFVMGLPVVVFLA